MKNELKKLNYRLKESLEKERYIPALLGNLFYAHSQITPPFYKSSLYKDCKIKRKRFSKAVKEGNIMFEIGLNGGHSSLLALSSNKNLKVFSNDIAEFYPPCPALHPEIYVNEAAKVLKEMFSDRFNFIKGSCLIEVPLFVEQNANLEIDLLHIDGEKNTYKQDFLNLLPILKDNAIIIFDDFQQGGVKKQVNELIQEGYLHRIQEYPTMKNQRLTNEILRYKK